MLNKNNFQCLQGQVFSIHIYSEHRSHVSFRVLVITPTSFQIQASIKKMGKKCPKPSTQLCIKSYVNSKVYL